ncbi:MAG TPA: ROK family protein [Saprospiraceae bacterium]|nr:ROK family protein [Saprospiraceae bacterium]
MALFGIDLGGTKLEGVVLESRENPVPLYRTRFQTEAHLGYQHIVQQIVRMRDLLQQESGLKAEYLGIGHPGTLDPNTGVIKNANTTVLNQHPFDQDLSQALGIPVRLANDANCFAVAEALMGAVPEMVPQATAVFGVILGTGVGGGWVLHGKVRNGRQGIGGEWGHNFLDESGGSCYCGHQGCVENVISGPALERYYLGQTGEKKTLKEIVALSETGNDPAAIKTLDRLIHFFGKAMAVVINIMDPDAVVLGGGVGNIERLYTDGPGEVQKHLFNHRIDTVFLRPKLGDSAGVFGAALL